MGDIDEEYSRDVIFRIKRGLCSQVSHLTACDMNQAFSEHVLYEPILQILTTQKCILKCEHPAQESINLKSVTRRT